MVPAIATQDVTLATLETKFALKLSTDEIFLTELTDLPSINEVEKEYLDRVKRNFLSLIKRPPVLEDAVKLVVLSPLLDLAGFYYEPFTITTEKSIEISIPEQEEIIRGRIDILVIQNQLWLLVVESKQANISLLPAIPQALSYMMANPDGEKPIFGLVTNGDDFQFIKLLKADKSTYALSDKFTLFRRENELYQVLSILRKLSVSSR
ncbi:type I restriction endonuclease [Calothrix sp. 336/3]|uniref:type I restriction endonuclease n=1 Tax=Calothrix sp. 336/3 TaxID=1337936 RepID=UPI0004E4128E|nr:type I restriction endonuclease [Calothrix sp. 336/3]AKG24157.1 restriction endonuclease subunit R [Calothrix sp. 336/3]